jgi:hypothetical protein
LPGKPTLLPRAFDKTAKGLGSATKGIAKIAGSVLSLKSALVLVGGAAGFGYLVKSSLNATDTLSKTANKIGTTTEALGGLRYAAEITGVATNTMDMALQRFTRRTAEAAKGTGEAKGAIKELGINAKELNQMPLDKRMLVLADAFSEVESESDQLRLAFKLFDSEGAALVNTLALGRDGLKDLLGEAKALGLTMSTSAAQGVEKANDSITKLMSLGKGLKDQFSAALAPAIESVVTQLTAFFQKIAEDEGGVEKWARSMAVGFLDSIQAIVKGLDAGLTAISGFVNKANAYLNSFEVKAQSDYIKRLKDEFTSLGKEIRGIQDGADNDAWDEFLGKDLDYKSKQWEDLAHEIRLAEESLEGLGKPIANNGLSEILDATNLKIDELKKAIGADSGGYVSIFQPITQDLSDLQQSFEDWSKALPDTTENIKSLTNQGLNGMTDALTAGITGAANFADAMKSMAKSVVDSLIKMLVQKYIVDAAFGAITSFIGGPTQTAPTGGGSGIPQFNPRGYAAIGGPVQAGSPYMVGERGQEMFVPNQSGSIIPNNKLGGGGGGVTVNQTINVSTGVQQTVRAEIATLMPQIANAAKGAVADARQRGGGFSKSLVGA